MNNFLFFALPSYLMVSSCQTMDKEFAGFDDYPIYVENDLGVQYSPNQTVFKLWAPTAELIEINLYENGVGGKPVETLKMSRTENGLWSKNVEKDLGGFFYTFRIKYKNEWLLETPGIYAKATGVNGQRAAIIDFQKTNPPNWKKDESYS